MQKNGRASGGCKKFASNKLGGGGGTNGKDPRNFSHSSKFWRIKALQKLEGMAELDMFKNDFERINEKFTC